jgi:hypothetical protein
MGTRIKMAILQYCRVVMGRGSYGERKTSPRISIWHCGELFPTCTFLLQMKMCVAPAVERVFYLMGSIPLW